jgi:hypothetical protein
MRCTTPVRVGVASLILALGLTPATLAYACGDGDPPAAAAASPTGPPPSTPTTTSPTTSSPSATPPEPAAVRPSPPTTSTPPPTVSSAPPGAAGPASAGAAADAPRSADEQPPTVRQQADVDSSGRATADTGGNTAAVTGLRAPEEQADASTGAQIAGGTSTATGNDTHDTIVQTVTADAADAAQIRLLQIALVINVGLALGESGGNTASATPVSTTGDGGKVDSGGAHSTGNVGTTRLVQAVVLTGSHDANQVVNVMTMGVGIARSGGNTAVVIGAHPDAQGALGDARIDTGSARATGNRSSSTIIQIVTAKASGHGQLDATQRAVVVNLGGALATSGRNVAGTAAGSSRDRVLDLLAQLFGGDAGAPAAGATGSVSSGPASAVGNATDTGIAQLLDGTVSGHQQARSVQDALVANVGVAVASSGGNGAVTRRSGGSPEIDAARTKILDFIAALLAGDPVDLDTTLALGSGTLHLEGGVSSAAGQLGSGDGSGVFVRQVSGVLNLGFGLADSGGNDAVVVIGDGGQVSDRTSHRRSGARSRATVRTGTARAVGHRFVVAVCQADGSHICAQLTATVRPDAPAPSAPDAAVAGRSASADPIATAAVAAPRRPAVTARAAGDPALPFTGRDITVDVLVGVGLVGLGLMLHRRARRASAH